jgi:hypothetical protein
MPEAGLAATNATGAAQAPAAASPRPTLSLILASRNDRFQGDSLWRLRTSLDHVAAQAAALGRLADIEVIVADWGSEAPLRDAVALSDEAARIVRFLTIPPALAREKQRDSRFAEVFALNAAARRSRGDYIGRIDQDTLVGRRFLAWFFEAAESGAEGFPLDGSIMISNRRRIPYRFAVRCPPFPVVERYLSWLDRRLPLMGGVGRHYWECYIGILLLHRRIWDECGGYDERLIYYSYMEFDLFLRVAMRYQGVDLGPIVGSDFHHLDHLPAWWSWNHQPRSNNNVIRTPEDPPPDFCPTGPDWGLVRYELALEPASPVGPTPEASELSWRPSHWPVLLWSTAASTVQTLATLVREQIHLRGVARGIAYTLLVSTGLKERLRRSGG